MIGCRLAERKPLAGQRDVDHVLGQRAVELGSLERASRVGDRGFDRLAGRVQGHPGLAVADLAERVLQLAAPAEVADAQLVELRRRRGGLDRAQGFALERLRVHARDCIACFSSARLL